MASQSRAWRRWLAAAAGLAGAAAALAGSPYRGARVDVAALAREVDDEIDHVSAFELARWLHAGRTKLRVIDVRSAREYAAYHLPSAEHLPLAALATARFAADETLVLYSETGAHAAQAWVFLRARGYRHVLFLRRGLHEWLEQVMSPSLAADASAEEVARFAAVEEVSRAFGGVPRRLSGTRTLFPEELPPALRGRGC